MLLELQCGVMLVQWDSGVVAASIIIGIVAATAALLIFFRFERVWATNIYLHVAASMLMGVAVCGMHYCGNVCALDVYVEYMLAGMMRTHAVRRYVCMYRNVR